MGFGYQVCLKSNVDLSPDSQNLEFKVWGLNLYTWILLPIRANPYDVANCSCSEDSKVKVP